MTSPSPILKMGFEAKCYYCTAGIGATPTWVELTHVKDLTLNLSGSNVDVSTRAGGSWKAEVGGLKEAAISFDMPWDTADAGLGVLRDAFLNRTLLGLAVMDGPIATAGSQGLWADCAVLKFDRSEKLGEDLAVSIEAKPTYSANAPLWKTIAGA